MRRCGRCGELKPFEHFAWRRKTRGQRDNYCRPCRAAYKQEHYARNRDRYIEAAVRRRLSLAAQRATFLVHYFSDHPCVDCGEADPMVLEFDHRGDKSFNIAKGLRDRGWDDLLEEIAKCDVVCANCHRRRTAVRGRYARVVAVGEA
jgi:hypothetical protein